MAAEKINAMALGFSLAIYGALAMLALSVLGLLGTFGPAIETMKAWHIGYTLSLGGIIIGMLEAAICFFISGLIIAYFYNRIVRT